MNAIEKHGKSIAVALCVAGCSPLALTVLAETDGWSVPEETDLKSTDATLAKEVSSDQIGIEEPANPVVESETVLAAVTSKAVDQIEAAAIQAVELSNIETQTENEIPASAVTEGNTMIAEAEIPEQAVQPVELPVEEAVQNTVAALSPAVEAVEQVDLIDPEEAPAPDVTLSKPDPEVFENFCMEPVLPVIEEPVYEEPVLEEPVYEEPVYEEPVIEEPVYEEPVYEEPVYEEPIIEEPVYEEPVYEEPIIEEPVYEEPVYEEPVYEEPVIEEPVYEEPVIEEPVIEEPVYEEPVYEEPEYTAPVNDYSALNAAIASSALDLVGVTDGLQCTEVVELALLNAGVPDAQCLWPDEYASTYGYYTDSPVAGNLIYYNNGGRGTDHIAIYIGDGMAVHGNYTDENGESRTVVASVYINGGEPQYIQVCR